MPLLSSEQTPFGAFMAEVLVVHTKTSAMDTDVASSCNPATNRISNYELLDGFCLEDNKLFLLRVCLLTL